MARSEPTTLYIILIVGKFVKHYHTFLFSPVNNCKHYILQGIGGSSSSQNLFISAITKS
jgi:hypothetical protein